MLEMETNKDHVHMLLEADSRKDLSAIVRTIKAVSAKKILEGTPHLRVGNAKGKSGYLWARRYGWKEVSDKELEIVRKYIQGQKNTIQEKDTTHVSV